MGNTNTIERDIVNLSGWPEEPAPVPELPTMEPSRERDMIKLTHDVEQQRAAAAGHIDHAMGELEATLALLESLSPDVDADLAKSQIAGSLSTLTSLRDQVHTANPALLANIVQSIPQAVASAQSTATKATRDAEKEENLIIGDVTVEKINRMSITAMADKLTAAHFAQMTTEQLDAVRAKTDQALAKADQEGKAVDVMLDQSPDTSEAYRTMRDQLAAEEEEARRSGNRQELARIQAMQSANREAELREQGMDALADKEAARGDDIRDAVRLIAREEAARKVNEQHQDMTPEEKAAFIEAAEAHAITELDADVDELAEERSALGESQEHTIGKKADGNLGWEEDQSEGQTKEVSRTSERRIGGGGSAFGSFGKPDPKMQAALDAAGPIANEASIEVAENQPEHSQDIQKPSVANAQPVTGPQMTVV